MKIKMVSYYLNHPSQAFATFEYQGIEFDMFRSKEEKKSHEWKFLEDQDYLKLKKIANLEQIEDSCAYHLKSLDNII